MVRFLAAKVIGLAVALSVLAFVLDGWRFEIPLGLLVGSLLSLYKTRLFSIFLKGSLSHLGGSGIKLTLVLVFTQILVLSVLLVSILINVRLFIGVTIGMLLLMAVICINSITERFGLTNNEWGDC